MGVKHHADTVRSSLLARLGLSLTAGIGFIGHAGAILLQQDDSTSTPSVPESFDGPSLRATDWDTSKESVPQVTTEPVAPLDWIEPRLGFDSPVIENARQRTRLLQKLNPMASDLLSVGSVGVVAQPDGDSEGIDLIGGLQSSRLLEPGRPRVTVDSYLQYHHERGAFQPGGAVAYQGLHLGTVPLGYRVAVSSDAGPNLFDQMFMRWRRVQDGSQAGQFYPSQVRYDRRLYDARSVAVQFDADLIAGAGNNLYFRGAWGETDIDSTRGAVEYRANQSRLNLDTFGPESAEFTDSRIIRSLLHEPETRTKGSALVGGGIERADWRMDYALTGSFWTRDRSEMARAEFEQEGVDFRYRVPSDDVYFPQVEILNGRDPFDTSAFRFREIALEDNVTEDRDWATAWSFRKSVLTRWLDGNLRVGGLYREKRRANRHDRLIWDRFDGTFGLDDVTYAGEEGMILQDRYRLGLTPDPGQTIEFLDRNRAGFQLNENASRLDSDPSRYVAEESVMGVYTGMDVSGERWWARAGSRWEWTQTDTKGNRVITDEQGLFLATEEVEASVDYLNPMPAVEGGYQVLPWMQARGGYYRSIARPSYYDLVPYQKVNRISLSIAEGNPELQAVTYDNLTVAMDYSLGVVGKVSTGVTRKYVDGFFYTSTSILGSGDFVGFEATRPENGGDGDAWIYEVAWRWDTPLGRNDEGRVGFLTSYTRSDTTGRVRIRPEDSLPLPEVARDLVRFEVSGSFRRVRTRFGLSCQDDSLSQVASIREYDRSLAGRLDLSMGAGIQIARQAAVTLDVWNVTDTADRFVEGDGQRATKNEYNSWRMKLGFQMVF